MDIYEDAGFKTSPAKIEWSRDLEENLDKAEELIDDFATENEEMHLFGHSWGAVCALWGSRAHSVETQVLASMSPEFKEDRERVPAKRFRIGKIISKLSRSIDKTVYPDKRPSLEELEDLETRDIRFLYGEREYRGWFNIKTTGFGKWVSEYRLETFPGSKEKVVGGAGHMLNDNYLDAIEQTVATLD